MIADLRQRIATSPVLADFTNAVFFGILSLLFGSVKIQMPAFEGITADFREIPLLIAVFYLRSFWWLFLVCGITILTPSSISWVTVYWMHLWALAFAWFGYHKFIKYDEVDWRRALAWIIVSSVYYLVFVVPLLLIINQWISPNPDFVFFDTYLRMLQLIKYEFVVTVLVTTMYLVQLDIRRELIIHELTLEEQVRDRTQKLASANEKLQSMNENLDDLAIQRSLKIKDQLNTLNKYAHMNSHELRAPLSNILGLVSLLKKKNDETERIMLIDSLDTSAERLDEIIKQMNELLEKEMKLPADRESK
ncbi:histidine kinase dimerization/phospho-acceptor domain-containing protein [Reichenbachiella sp.]|uniref:histidine kinase dimerization/phospho-acceptor domain-containing protein n=1 Tax=Reichenbachiella sp. TaxID=2184521 RepID=UPI003BAED2EB